MLKQWIRKAIFFLVVNIAWLALCSPAMAEMGTGIPMEPQALSDLPVQYNLPGESGIHYKAAV